MGAVYVNDRGERWCTDRRKAKRVFDSPDEAWIAAFQAFAFGGLKLTPYRCGRLRIHTGEVRTRIVGNPYAFQPFRQYISSHKIERRGCGFWHLTSALRHVLTA